MPGTSSFDSEPLFMSGPHRFSLEPQGSLVISRLSTRVFDAGSILLGPLELAVIVRGRLVATDDATLDDLHNAIRAKLAYPPVTADLVDLHDRTYGNMQLVRFETGDRVDRGRVVSLSYTARFLHLYVPAASTTPDTGSGGGGGGRRSGRMNEVDFASTIAQFGAAGLMGWMWLSERRTAAVRDQQVAQSHERLMETRSELDVLVRALESNTRAITALEVGQRHVLEVLARLAITGKAVGAVPADDGRRDTPRRAPSAQREIGRHGAD